MLKQARFSAGIYKKQVKYCLPMLTIISLLHIITIMGHDKQISMVVTIPTFNDVATIFEYCRRCYQTSQ